MHVQSIWMKYLSLISIVCLLYPILGQKNEAQSIQVRNQGAFYMNFKASNGDQNSPSTPGYPISGTETIDLTTTALTEGRETWPIVSAVLGNTRAASDHFIYKKNCKIAVYTVKGTTLSYTITLDGIQSDPACGAQFIEVENDGGFVMSFVVSNGRTDSASSSKYPIGQTRTIDLTTNNFAENDMVWPVVAAVLGRTEPAPEHIKYLKNGKTAKYYVTGATLSFNIVLDSIKEPKVALASASPSVASASANSQVDENKAQKILIKNRAAFVMNFKATNGEQESSPSSNYPIGESQTIDLATTKLSEGKETWPIVSVILGTTKPASNHFIYEKNCKVAVYTVTGTTLSNKIHFDGFQVDPTCGSVSSVPRAAAASMVAMEAELLNEAQRILIKNRAGFVMNFKVTNGQQTTKTTNDYPIGLEDSIDLATTDLTEGKETWAVVHAVWGKTKDASHIIYKKNCKTAVYTVTGATLTYKINFDGIITDPTCGAANVAQIIEIENEAWFAMHFQASFGGEDSGPTPNYPVGKSRSIDLASTEFPEGVKVWPIVSAELGKTQAANDHFKYEKNCKTAHYTVKGTTLQYTINFDSIKDTECRVPPIAQKIAVINSGGFYMDFQVSYGEELSLPSRTYPINDMDTIDLASSTFYTGIEVWPVVSAKLGKTIAANERIIFDFNCKTALYKVTGTTLNFVIEYQGLQDDSCPPPPGIPAPAFPLNQVRFINWAKNVDVPNLWCAAPRTREEVLTICNWAKDNGYRVRPRGIMHNWSPLTVPDKLPPTAKVLLVDTTKYLHKKQLITKDGKFAVVVETGTTMSDLLEFLEQQDGGKGSAPGFGFPHTPAPGHITVGGVLAINAHGSGVKGQNPNDNFETLGGYGSMSNHIIELTAVVSDSNGKYGLKTFVRGKDQDIKVFLTHLGRALIVEATLAVVDNYNLRCESFMNISAADLFQQPNAPGADPSKWFGTFFAKSGRVEAIWFPFSEEPWMKVWTVSPTKPQESRLVYTPFNYIFAENLSPEQEALFENILKGVSSLTPDFGKLMGRVSKNGLQGNGFFGGPSYPQSYDIWGPSKNTLLYVKDSTLPETANGYAILIKKETLQQAVADVYTKHATMLKTYNDNRQWPINGPLEIRVTSLDHGTSTSGAGLFDRPIISSLAVDQEVIDKKWDVAVWFDVLTLPDQYTNQFYVEFENWLLSRFSGDAGRVVPEWSKGWGYTVNGGPWTSVPFLQHVIDTYTKKRAADDTWQAETTTLNNNDGSKMYISPLLEWLFSKSVVPFETIEKEDL